MTEPVFPDKTHMPDDTDVARVLGRTMRHWDNLKAHALELNPAATEEWKYYMKKTGWTFLLRGQRRNVLFMRPTGKRRFTVSFVFGGKAVQAAEQSDLPTAVVEALRQAPQYPEGRGVSVEVSTAADVKIAKQLLAIKMAN
ncbi:MAG: DUF3788 domain-containing protein [Planctomycetes bacterium]|nr:DUF3788 domain-containing protein [Planctomycetota bacterium]